MAYRTLTRRIALLRAFRCTYPHFWGFFPSPPGALQEGQRVETPKTDIARLNRGVEVVFSVTFPGRIPMVIEKVG